MTKLKKNFFKKLNEDDVKYLVIDINMQINFPDGLSGEAEVLDSNKNVLYDDFDIFDGFIDYLGGPGDVWEEGEYRVSELLDFLGDKNVNYLKKNDVRVILSGETIDINQSNDVLYDKIIVLGEDEDS